MNYESAKALLDARGPRVQAPGVAIPGVNHSTTRLLWRPTPFGDGTPAIAIRFHDTDVVTFYPDGRVRLNTGGYKTKTTKQRMELVDDLRMQGYEVSGWTREQRGTTPWAVVRESLRQRIHDARKRAGDDSRNAWQESWEAASIPYEDGMVLSIAT